MNRIFKCNMKHKQFKMVRFIKRKDKNLFWVLEFIVQFKGYYHEITRSNYLIRVFQRNNISHYDIIKRKNLMQHYPSDFDIVRVCYGEFV